MANQFGSKSSRPGWPFMARTASENEAAPIPPEVWNNLTRYMPRPRSVGKSFLTEKLVREYLELCEQRQREGRAAIAQAVRTLLSPTIKT